VEAGDPLRSDTDRLLEEAGVPPSRIIELRKEGVVA
jgi:hypothetical protein